MATMTETLEVVPLGDEHLEPAAALFAARYQEARARQPLLPASHGHAEPILPKLRCLAHKGLGVAAMRDRRMVGYMLARVLPAFRGRRAAYVAEWAHAAESADRRQIYQEMYACLAGRLVNDGCLVQLVTLLADDAETVETFSWQGFGLQCVDALRDLGPLAEVLADMPVRRAEAGDVCLVQAFDRALLAHLQSSPILLPPSEPASQQTVVEWLADPRQAIFLAGPAEEPVGLARVQPANASAAFVISDPKTASITAMFTRPAERSRGVGTALLDQVLAWARGEGYERCAVDFESQNLPGGRFWMRHFRPVCYSVRRCVDERASTEALP